MNAFLAGLAEVSLAMTAVIGGLLALTPVLDRRFAPAWRYWVWLAVAVRLVIPLNISLPGAPVRLAAPAAEYRITVSPEPADVSAVRPLPTGPAAGEAEEGGPTVLGSVSGSALIPADGAVFVLWAAGASGFLLWQGADYLRFRRTVRRWSRKAGEYGGLPVWECPLAESPLLMGFRAPVIVLPQGLEGEEREFALLHEYTHFVRRDLWYQLLLTAANALHWFNPAVWLFRRAAGREAELACDAQILRGQGADYRRRYGAALLRTAVGGHASAAALTSRFSGGRRDLKRRFVSLMDGTPRRPGRLALAAAVCAALLAGSLVSCGEKTTLPEGLEIGELRVTVEENAFWSGGTAIHNVTYTLPVACADETALAGLSWELEPSEALRRLTGFKNIQGFLMAPDGESGTWEVRFESGNNAVREESLARALAEEARCTITVSDGKARGVISLEAVQETWTEPEQAAGTSDGADQEKWSGVVHAKEGSYDAQARTFTFQPLSASRETMTWRAMEQGPWTLPIDREVELGPINLPANGIWPEDRSYEQFYFESRPVPGSAGDSLLELTVAEDRIIAAQWVAAYRQEK
ncbi:M56 family metallopeptidase [Pseudoflavonifractor sp. HCP28S3_F10]|uniref:M56 family metallopeptidase n=1 Tax=Pseudoflavonifractor sp. HCP28S3_F10 TaxID=3438947 RepID=UPI003F89424C